MNKLYMFFGLCIIVCGAYVCGANVADAKCRARIIEQNLSALQNYQNQIIKNKRKNREIVYKTDVDDIRRILRDKYSIAE